MKSSKSLELATLLSTRFIYYRLFYRNPYIRVSNLNKTFSFRLTIFGFSKFGFERRRKNNNLLVSLRFGYYIDQNVKVILSIIGINVYGKKSNDLQIFFTKFNIIPKFPRTFFSRIPQKKTYG